MKKVDAPEVTERDSLRDPHSCSAFASNPATSNYWQKWSYETLVSVPELASAFRAFAFKALCLDSVEFLEEVSK